MELWLDGIKFGLILSFMIGPIFFALVQTGVEEGFIAGAMLGLGVWVSDALYILAVYFGLSQLAKAAESATFAWSMGAGGGIVLTVFGLFTLLSKPKIPLPQETEEVERHSSFWLLFSKGFLINTINPFTVFFWTSLMGTYVAKGNFGPAQAKWLFGMVLATIVITDSLKVLLAKKIRRFLRPLHFIWLRRASGVALIAFALVLLGRVWWMNAQ
jgi:threonine/homoserine/homoserine lactone efflux protein